MHATIKLINSRINFIKTKSSSRFSLYYVISFIRKENKKGAI